MTSVAILAFSAPVTAFEMTKQSEEYSVEELLGIEAEREVLYNLVREQLIVQDAEEYFDVFKEVADQTIEMRYFSDTMVSRANQKIYAPNGGYTYGENSYVDMHTSYYNESSTAQLYQNRNSSSLESALSGLAWSGIESMLGSHGIIAITAAFLDCLSESMIWDSINNGTGCAYIISTYDKQEHKYIHLM